MDIKNIPNKYRPVPFWSWNEKLNTRETARQAQVMNDAGLGGYFMHARGGLQTEYMGDEWFDNVAEGVNSAKRLGMSAWAYDENGWPSGFGNGAVNGLGEEYQQKYLRMEKGEKNGLHTVYSKDGYHFYYEVNPFYVDNLNGDVVRTFIEKIYEPYYQKFGNEITGFFTDEPEISENGIPWSHTLPREYKNEYGEELLPLLIQLFVAEGDYINTRKKFWRLITKLFSKNYFCQIYEWCQERGLKFTGHLISETTMKAQVTSNGACMPHYEYFHIPGIDWLGRKITRPLLCHQVASAAAQTGKKQILSESYALCGHGVSFSELRRIAEWQMVRGINLFCPHLEGYSLRGLRKRDYPPAMYYQQPWWDEYSKFTDALSRTGMLIAEGKSDCTTLLMHPQTTVWTLYDSVDNNGVQECNINFNNTVELLENKHIQFHLGDEILIERHGRVEGNKFIIGEMEYTTIIISECAEFLDKTKTLLAEFEKNGGKILNPADMPDNSVTDNGNITYLKRIHDDFVMHYFVNSTETVQNAYINVRGVKLDAVSGDTWAFDRNYMFEPMDSLIVLEYKNSVADDYTPKKLAPICTDGEWNLISTEENALTLDYCKCLFDGELVSEKINVMEIQEMACALKRPVDIKLSFEVDIRHIPENLCLVCETPEIYDFAINGTKAEFCDEGWYRDKSFRKTNIFKYAKQGINTIELSVHFCQSDKVYEDISNFAYAEVRNKFTYDMEIEALYLIGDFGVKTEGEFTPLDRNALRYSGNMIVDKLPEKIFLKNIEQQGFAFFAGRFTVSKKFNLTDTAKKLSLRFKGLNGAVVYVNGQYVKTQIWNNTDTDISEYLVKGENEIKITFVNNLRNLLGPHHLNEGESYTVRPSSFLPGNSIWHWRSDMKADWNDDYCFIEMSAVD